MQAHRDTSAAASARRGAIAGSEPASISDRLTEEDIQRVIKFTIAVYAAVGVGYGLALFLLFRLAGDVELALVGAESALGASVLFAPLLAAITGLASERRLDRGERDTALAAGVGTSLGFLAMFLGLYAVITVLDPTGVGSSVALTQLLFPLLGYAAGVGATGAMVAYVSTVSKEW